MPHSVESTERVICHDCTMAMGGKESAFEGVESAAAAMEHFASTGHDMTMEATTVITQSIKEMIAEGMAARLAK